jgi:hypothetical protein
MSLTQTSYRAHEILRVIEPILKGNPDATDKSNARHELIKLKRGFPELLSQAIKELSAR